MRRRSPPRSAKPCWASRAARRSPRAKSRRSGFGRGSSPRSFASTTRCIAIRRTSTRSSAWRSGMLEPGAADDRGAERLVRQTRFLVSAFRRFEQRRDATGAIDEHALRSARPRDAGGPSVAARRRRGRRSLARSLRAVRGRLGSAGACAGPRASRRRRDRPDGGGRISRAHPRPAAGHRGSSVRGEGRSRRRRCS